MFAKWKSLRISRIPKIRKHFNQRKYKRPRCIILPQHRMNYLPRRRITATTQIPHFSRKLYCVHNTSERKIDNQYLIHSWIRQYFTHAQNIIAMKEF